ncbi:hypothetical protein TIFTF001_014143 [Ficus carica]|uniref:Mesoderm development candidate 2 n=1 Tax=Ficus carica TaxID=3494 RepID=A0AA88DIE2_FICCA|nr:hypothetical protein TIFTF001_014143 [Ficus carica]
MPNLITVFPLLLLLVVSRNGGPFSFVEGGKGRIHITDDLDDIVDDEEDESWRQWGKKSTPSSSDDDLKPSDLSNMAMSEIQAELINRQSGPAFGFVKLRLGVNRSQDMVSEIAMKWTKVLKTGGVEAKFMIVDLSTIMFTMERGQDVSELKEFVLDQEEAYEIKLGDQAFRRPGDPPLEEVVEKLREEEKKKMMDGGSKEEL